MWPHQAAIGVSAACRWRCLLHHAAIEATATCRRRCLPHHAAIEAGATCRWRCLRCTVAIDPWNWDIALLRSAVNFKPRFRWFYLLDLFLKEHEGTRVRVPRCSACSPGAADIPMLTAQVLPA